MEERQGIKISVRNLVEFVLRSGDLDMRFTGTARALEGTRIHQKLQKSNKENNLLGNLEYHSEVTLSHSFEYKNFLFCIEGRADGIIIPKKLNDEESRKNNITIDEIKSTTKALELIDYDYNVMHWAQGKCYAYIYAIQNELEVIEVQLSYYQVDTDEIKYLRKSFNISELENFFFDLMEKYIQWAEFTKAWNAKRDQSIRSLKFPFENYRKGQRELAVAVYKTITNEKKSFIQAPTGIGKTISTLFPAIKAMGEGHISKIFYLTAKTITRKVAEDAFEKMRNSMANFQFKSITLTAKEKICFNKGVSCNPEACNFAKGHFDRVNSAIMDLIQNENDFTREIIEEYANKHTVCPFEFSLDIALWSDCIICDYNYAFDPRIYLKRFFMESTGEYLFLVDEAHNLVDRAREMFSAELNKRTFLELKKAMQNKQPKIAKALGKLNSFMLDLKRKCIENKNFVIKEEPKEIYPLLKKFIKESEEWLTKNEHNEVHDELLTLYFDALAFIKISELYDERYVTYIEDEERNVKIKLFCLDPSYLLAEAAKRGKTAVYFSATLAPINYYREILGGSKEDNVLRLSSPFDRKNLCLLIGERTSTKYKYREKSYDEITSFIKSVIDKKKGNYFVFFPSYKYMNEVYRRFSESHPEVNILLQENSMGEEAREEFLLKFEANNKGLIAFAVLGGIFSEGIDLRGDKLIGAIIVGVGLPQICLEREIIKEYFQKKNRLGYEYSYMFPGMNKVLQAAGRVIRAEEDKGIVLLLDERFASSIYQSIFPNEWQENIKIRNTGELENRLDMFWME